MTDIPTPFTRPDDAATANSAAPTSTSNPLDAVNDAPESSNAYDPEEYRWVPVRRRPRYDGWTEEKQRRFIEALADTGLVNKAAQSVGMSRESANRLRRSPHGASFARAWEAARQHSGCAIEDIAFERAIEGIEHNVYDEFGDVICTKRVYNDRLLMFLLRHLKPERYGKGEGANTAPFDDSLEARLRAMEPQLPAPPELLVDTETLEEKLVLADAADGILPQFLAEQMPDLAAREAEQRNYDAKLRTSLLASRLLTRGEPPRRRFR